ncbi:MAG: hypothetical protein IKU53_01310, partial [Firmicutes bacterium]|nr:hypothetical protein [Bacillota bacterium]
MNMKIEKGRGVFAKDETESTWRRREDVELLKVFCIEGYQMAKKYKHFIVGSSSNQDYIGIPGRFLLEEQPAGGKTGFTLWQPLKGGEEMYASLETMDEETSLVIYGYWIARIDSKT